MRVWQWTKNALVFAPLVFGAGLLSLDLLSSTILVFFAMCFAASAAYVLNDLFDINEDRKHPFKKNRPIASGAISKHEAYVLLTLLLILASGFAVYVSTSVMFLVTFYIILNLLYSKVLKHMVIIDILIVAFFYIYRVYVGGIASDLHISGWLVMTTFCLSLFMITGKRRAEIASIENKPHGSRKVLSLYNQQFLDAALVMSITLFIVFYSLYSILVQDGLFIMTILPVVYISFRYLYLAFVKNEGEEPEKLIFKDKEILMAGFILGTLIIAALYLNLGWLN